MNNDLIQFVFCIHSLLNIRYSLFSFMSYRTKSWAVSPDTCNRQRGLRSLPHLREQFKSRTDDGHASPAQLSLWDNKNFSLSSVGFQILVRFFVCHRIKPHNPLLVQVPVYSFEF